MKAANVEKRFCKSCNSEFSERIKSAIYCSFKCAAYMQHKFESNRKSNLVIQRNKSTIIEDLEGETWRDVSGYEGFYVVSNQGRVKSLFRMVVSKNGAKKSISPKIIASKISGDGYTQNCLFNNTGKRKYLLTHRIAANAFIANPENKPQVNHKNGIKDDNRVENLEWVTRSENQLHALQTGLYISQYGEKRPMSKLNESVVSVIKRRLNEGEKSKDLAIEYGVNSATISNIKTGSTWKQVIL